LLAVALLGASIGTHGLPAATPSQNSDAILARDVMVAMRDGVRLATDVYLPARGGMVLPGRFPTLLARTPYGRDEMASSGWFFAQHGYAVVIQDVRGRYGSEGEFYIYVNEGRDGYDALEWAARQPWSDGQVGTFGPSYRAGTQNALAVERPTHLRAMCVVVGTSNYHEDGAARGGAAYLLHNVAYAFGLAATSKEAREDSAREAALRQASGELGAWLKAYPFAANASPLSLVPAYQRWFQDFVDHADYDDYWKQNGFTFEQSYDRYPDVPMYFISGWYDIFLRGTLQNFVGLARRQQAPKKLLVGPWVHGVGSQSVGDVDFGHAAAMDVQMEQLRWFDQVLKGRDTGILGDPSVRFFVMGGGSGGRTPSGHLDAGGAWRTASAWPPPGTATRVWYFHRDGVLDEKAPEAEPPTIYTFDPTRPVPTIGGQIDSGKEIVPAGPFDQRCLPQIFGCEDTLPLAARRDVRVYQTAPLEADVVLAGPITLELWISSSAPDTDFTAKVIDVAPPNPDYPSGYAMNVTDRIVRVRYCKSPEHEELLRTGEVRQCSIDLLGTANRFVKGHRIRVDLSSSNFPFFDVNPNTGERVGQHTRMVEALNTVYHDRDHPTRLIACVDVVR
jgi:uncharacterized protein